MARRKPLARSALWLPLFDELADPTVCARLVAEAEDAGWHGFFVWDQPVRSYAVSSEHPYVRLPDRIELSLAEAGELLEVLDIAAVLARTDAERAAVSDASHMVTTKLWPGLGDLFDGDDEA